MLAFSRWAIAPLLVLSFTAPPTALAQQALTLPRVGAEIDAYEAQYFGLFQRLGAVERVHFERAGDERVAVIGRPGQRDTSLAFSAEQVDLLGQYLINFEDEAAIRALELRPLEGVFRYAVRLQPGLPVRVALAEGGRVDGTLLFADREAIVLSLARTPFQWDRLGEQFALALAWREVAEVETQLARNTDKDRRLMAGMVVGVTNVLLGSAAMYLSKGGMLSTLGAASNVVSAAILWSGPDGGRSAVWIGGDPARGAELAARWSGAAAVEDRAAFWTLAAPEVVALAREAAARPQSSSGAVKATPTFRRLHVQVGGMALGPQETSFDGQYSTGFGREDIGAFRNPGTAFVADVAYGVSRRLRFGVSGSLSSPMGSGAWVGQVRTLSGAPYASVVLKPAQMSTGTFKDRTEVSVAGGVALGQTRLRIPMEFSPVVRQLGPIPAEDDRTASTFGVGPYARVAVSLYAQPNVALTTSLGYRQHPEGVLAADTGEYAFGNASGSLYRYSETRVRPMPIELYVGVSWHL